MATSFSGTPLTTFMDATEVEIRYIIKLSHAKSCELDPLPIWLLKLESKIPYGIKNSMFDPLQSAYIDKHSTYTALIKVRMTIYQH